MRANEQMSEQEVIRNLPFANLPISPQRLRFFLLRLRDVMAEADAGHAERRQGWLHSSFIIVIQIDGVCIAGWRGAVFSGCTEA